MVNLETFFAWVIDRVGPHRPCDRSYQENYRGTKRNLSGEYSRRIGFARSFGRRWHWLYSFVRHRVYYSGHRLPYCTAFYELALCDGRL